MTKPSKKELDKLKVANKPKPQLKATTKPKVSPVKAMKDVVAKKVSAKENDQAKKEVTTHKEHVDIAKLAYQHLHEKEDKFAKPPNTIHDTITPLESVEPSIPVHSVAIAPKLTIDPLPVTKDGKLKWSDIKARLPSQN